MSALLKRWFGIAAILLLILFGMGVIFPWIISTNLLPLSLILILAVVTLTLGIALIWHIIKHVLLGRKAMRILNKTIKDIIDMESKK